MAPVWEQAVHSLRGAPHVIDVRNLGMVAGIELESRAGRPATRAYDAFVDCFFNQNLLVRTTGDIIALSPPLIISEVQIEELVTKLRRALEATN
jgi:beta-alanine--pyruvate transaminase